MSQQIQGRNEGHRLADALAKVLAQAPANVVVKMEACGDQSTQCWSTLPSWAFFVNQERQRAVSCLLSLSVASAARQLPNCARMMAPLLGKPA